MLVLTILVFTLAGSNSGRRGDHRSTQAVLLTHVMQQGLEAGNIIDIPIKLPTLPRRLPHVQIILNAPDADEIDLYFDGKRIWNDVSFQAATPLVPVIRGRHKIEIVAGADSDNSHPILSQTLTVRQDVNYVVIALGLVNPDPGEPAFQFVVQDKVRGKNTSVEVVDFLLVHGAPCLGEIDLRTLDPVRNNEVIRLLVNNIGFGEVSAYLGLEAGLGHNIEVVTSDSTKQIAVFRFELPVPIGQTFVVNLSCPDQKNAEGITMMGVEIDGSVFFPPVITAFDPGPELPETVALSGNYPNPFNPSTTIVFDLSETAEVSVEILDLLGRRVMTLPARQIEAGAARTVEVEASNLASGTYLYRLITRTATETRVKTGRMMLIK